MTINLSHQIKQSVNLTKKNYFVQIMHNISVSIIKKNPTFTFAGILHQKFCLAQFFVWVQFVLLAATRTTLFGKISIPLHPLILLLIEATLHQSWHITTIFLYTLIFLYKKKRKPFKALGTYQISFIFKIIFVAYMYTLNP